MIRWAFIVVSLLVFVIIRYVIDFSAITPAMSNTSQYLDGAMEALQSGGDKLDKQFYMTALIIGSIPESIRDTVIFLWGCFLIWLFVSKATNLRAGILALLLVLPPEVFALRIAFKETISAAVFAVIGTILMKENSKHGFRNAIIIMLLFAYFFRSYYYITAMVSIIVYLLSTLKLEMRLAALVPLTVIFVFVGINLPGDIFQTLQGARDLGIYRIGDIGGRTVFSNPFSPDGFFNFLGNYLYAIVRLNVPLAFFFTVSEFLMTIILIVYGYSVLGALRSPKQNIQIAGMIYVSHILVLWLFEPDYGSYLRHLTGSFALLMPFIAGYGRGSTEPTGPRDIVPPPHGNRLRSSATKFPRPPVPPIPQRGSIS